MSFQLTKSFMNSNRREKVFSFGIFEYKKHQFFNIFIVNQKLLFPVSLS